MPTLIACCNNRKETMHKQSEKFTGFIENAIPHKDICWVHTDAGEVLFCHKNYTLKRELPKIGARVKGLIGRVEGEDKQARAFNVEVVNGH
jgi:hypothetical protein